jgi:hypothetical protein
MDTYMLYYFKNTHRSGLDELSWYSDSLRAGRAGIESRLLLLLLLTATELSLGGSTDKTSKNVAL